jgi:hypothetical protein
MRRCWHIANLIIMTPYTKRNRPRTTTDAGFPVPSQEHSLIVRPHRSTSIGQFHINHADRAFRKLNPVGFWKNYL